MSIAISCWTEIALHSEGETVGQISQLSKDIGQATESIRLELVQAVQRRAADQGPEHEPPGPENDWEPRW